MGSHKEKFGAQYLIGSGKADLGQRRYNIMVAAAVRLLLKDAPTTQIGDVDYSAIPPEYLFFGSIVVAQQAAKEMASQLQAAASSGKFDINDLLKTNARLNWVRQQGDTCLSCKLLLTRTSL